MDNGGQDSNLQSQPQETSDFSFKEYGEAVALAKSNKATASMILGIIGIFVNILVLAVLALIFSWMTLSKMKQGVIKPMNKGQAIVGLALGIAGTVGFLFLVVLGIFSPSTPIGFLGPWLTGLAAACVAALVFAWIALSKIKEGNPWPITKNGATIWLTAGIVGVIVSVLFYALLVFPEISDYRDCKDKHGDRVLFFEDIGDCEKFYG